MSEPTPFSDETPVPIEIVTERALAEVFLVDHSFRLVGRGVGSLQAEVAPGVYKVKAHLGATTIEELVLVNREMTGAEAVDLSARVELASPAPILGTAVSHDFQGELAADESLSVDVDAGNGAEIFLMTRRWSAADASDGTPAELTGLSLHDPNGRVVADLLELKAPTANRDPAAGALLEVDPGPYFLRWSENSGIAAEQAIHAVAGWQTQVFLVEEELGAAGGRRHDVSVLLSRDPFNPADPRLAVVEEARVALAEERKVATELFAKSLFVDFENPMLELLGAHLMLIADEALRSQDDERLRPGSTARPGVPVQFDQVQFDRVVARLRQQLGGNHPDVVALATRSSHQWPPVRLTAPPLLWRSWQLLLRASNMDAELVPPEVWRRTLGALSARPFFIWAPAEDQEGIVGQWEEQIAKSLAAAGPPPEPLQLPAGQVFSLSNDGPEDPRVRLGRELMVPRSVIDDLFRPEGPAGGSRQPGPA